MRSLALLLLAAVAACAPRPLPVIGASVLPMDRPGDRVLENQAVFVRSVRIVQPAPTRVPPPAPRVNGHADAPDLHLRADLAEPETASAVFP